MNIARSHVLVLIIFALASCSYLPSSPIPSSTEAAAPSAPNLTGTPAPDTSAPPSPLPATTDPGPFARLDLLPNIETIGVTVSGLELPKTAELYYQSNGEAAWRRGHPLMQIDDGRLIGSLFELSPSTTYNVKVVDGAYEISGTVTTQPVELPFTPAAVIYVDDDAPEGGDGTVSAPYQTVQEGVNHAAPGMQILVADGVYREAITFPVSGTPGNWIQVKAAGSGAVLDGSTGLTGAKWRQMNGARKVWFVALGSPLGYLARDGQRFYNYDDLGGLKQGLGHGKAEIKEGWYYEASTGRLFIRTSDHPSNHSWQVPRLNHAFDVIERDWIWIEGFEIRHYGTDLEGCGVCALDASHLVIRKNQIHNLQLGIYVNWKGSDSQGNDTRIEENEIYDPPVNEWPWKAVKGSSMEGTGIVLRGHIGAIVRGNHIHNFFNGIYTGSSAASAIENPEVAFDADIYDNVIHHISDDGLEPEGACVNQRFRNNKVDRMLVGISFAPITQGPTWAVRNLFTNFSSTSIKWSSGSDGVVLFYHNTSWTDANGVNAMSMIQPVHNAVMRNNIFQGDGYAFEEAFTGSMGHDWNFDNWYTTRDSSGIHFQWESIAYQTIAQLCAATGLECNGHENPPGLVDPNNGDFTLLPTSPNIDRGVLITGINDFFSGVAPDIGAFEYKASP